MHKKPKIREIHIKSSTTEIHTVEQELEDFCEEHRICEDDVENFGIATTEMVNNAIRHGNKGDRKKLVTIRFELFNKQMKVIICDSGKGFDPESIADPLDPKNLYKESGRGIFIVKTLMDQVKFNFTKNGTQIILIKSIKFI